MCGRVLQLHYLVALHLQHARHALQAADGLRHILLRRDAGGDAVDVCLTVHQLGLHFAHGLKQRLRADGGVV